MSQAGYGKTRKEVKSVAGMVAVDKGKGVSPLYQMGGFEGLCKGNHIYHTEGRSYNERPNELLLVENQLLNSPNRIYNVDETGIALDGHALRIVAKRGQKKVRYRTSGNKNQITVIACVSASGQCIPPFVIFDAKRLNME